MLRIISEKIRIFEEHGYPFLFGGSKARKLNSILDNAKEKHSNAIVSAGSATSNHARDCALACAQLGWKCTLVIHDVEDYSQQNLFLMKLSGANLVFCEMADVSLLMDNAMKSYRSQGFNPYYIWGGGHSVYGSLALKHAVDEFANNNKNWIPDYVIVASGTGGTQAGLHVGFEQLFPNTKVIGISVARDNKRGTDAVLKAVRELTDFCNLPPSKNNIFFKDDYVGAGYGCTYPELINVVKEYAEKGVFTDLTYTGKALYGLVMLLKNKEISANAKILFWHTGGAFNLLDDKNKILETM